MREHQQTPFLRDQILIAQDTDENYYVARQRPVDDNKSVLYIIDPLWEYIKRARCHSLDDIVCIGGYGTVIDKRSYFSQSSNE